MNIPQLPHIKASPILMHQLFYNLISNALKFTREGIPPVINIHTGYEDNLFFIAVTDNGIGIEPRYAECIFKAFERLHSKDVYEGTGLGLALCQKIVSQYEGRRQLKSEAGKGAVFTVAFPKQLVVTV
jgi:signal transduction histidine kinase